MPFNGIHCILYKQTFTNDPWSLLLQLLKCSYKTSVDYDTQYMAITIIKFLSHINSTNTCKKFQTENKTNGTDIIHNDIANSPPIRILNTCLNSLWCANDIKNHYLWQNKEFLLVLVEVQEKVLFSSFSNCFTTIKFYFIHFQTRRKLFNL